MLKDDKTRRGIILITFGVVLYLGLNNISMIYKAINYIYTLLSPIIVGGILAFVLNVPMSQIEKRLDKRFNKKKSNRSLSLALTLIFVVLIIVIMSVVIIPEFIKSISQLSIQIQKVLPNWSKELNKLGLDSSIIDETVNFAKNPKILETIKIGMGGALSAVISTVSNTIGVVANIILSIVFTIYFLLSKEMLSKHLSWLIYKILPETIADKIVETCTLLQFTFAKFFSGQCLESIILGTLIFIAFSICGLPYAGLIAITTAVTAFIPYVGAFLSCGIGVLLTLLISPIKALIALVVYQVVQFCEDQFIYPRVVGSAVGLPVIYTVIAVFLGGKLYGIVGMIFFIPIAATAYTLIKHWFK